MVSAVIGLVGVIVGALVTGGFQWWVAARADRLDARTARRMVKAELVDLKVLLESLESELKTIPPEVLSDPTVQRRPTMGRLAQPEVFPKYCDRLARNLSDHDWSVVSAAYGLTTNAGQIAEHVKDFHYLIDFLVDALKVAKAKVADAISLL
jgi:hypothetical protein